jgi:3-deoxy-D-manno-octulosonate 8-phosphate phosphatase (KDO 8-P phosphatase)
MQTVPFKLLILDVDGVLTDGGMYYLEDGSEFKKFNTKDGLAIRRIIKEYKLPVGIISNGSKDKLIESRAQTLYIERVYVGHDDKLSILEEWCKELQIDLSEVAYIGDDVNDLACMSKVGYAVCPADAVDKIKEVAHIILKRNGGQACVREFIEMYFDIH